MEKMKKKLSENILDKLSMDFLRNQVLKNAYGNDDTFIAALDPRLLFIWYVFFALVPWFVDDLIFLLGCFILVAVTTVMAKVAGLVLLLFGVGVFFPDRISFPGVPFIWRKRRNRGAAAGPDA